MKFALLVSLALLASACASPAPDGAVDTAALRCATETPTGTNLPVKRCRSQEEIDREREAGRAALEGPRRTRGSATEP